MRISFRTEALAYLRVSVGRGQVMYEARYTGFVEEREESLSPPLGGLTRGGSPLFIFAFSRRAFLAATGQTPALSEVEGDESSAGTNARGKARAANFRPEETREQIGGRADRAAKKGGKGGKRLSMRCMERRG